MFKKAPLFVTFLLLAASAFAQDRMPSYAPGREQLAEDTFKQLVEISSSYDQLNMAADLAACTKAIEDYPDLRAALLENFIFAYCHVPDSLKTEENFLVNKLDGKRFYAARSNEKWNQLGEVYLAKRMEME